MKIANVGKTPKVWTEEELFAQAQIALDEFVDRRLAEPGGKYQAHVHARRSAIIRLFKALAGVDPISPDPAVVRKVMFDAELFDALRYVTGPPVSEDDLGVLVTRSVEGFNKTDLGRSEQLPVDVLRLIFRRRTRQRSKRRSTIPSIQTSTANARFTGARWTCSSHFRSEG